MVGDYDSLSITLFFHLIEKKTIVVPLTKKTNADYSFFINTSCADFIIEDNIVKNLNNNEEKHHLIHKLILKNNPGLIFFSTGTTGVPKAILHDVSLLFKRFQTPRQAFRTINFLMFDHMGGINTLLHTLFNGGTIITPEERTVNSILSLCEENHVQLLPATPTFLRMLLLSGYVPDRIPKSIKIISYGTEMMDINTLSQLCELLPSVNFKQTYGLSEFCVLRVKNKSNNGLFIKIGGEGVEVKVHENVLYLRSKYSMLGYLNADSPFDTNGWYNTKDIVELDNDGFMKIVGRSSDIVNVGGLKFMKSEVENILLKYPDIAQVKIQTKNNPITGQHIESVIETKNNVEINKKDLDTFIRQNLARHMRPQKIVFNKVEISARFKRK